MNVANLEKPGIYTYDVPKDQQIEVRPGDIIGVHNNNPHFAVAVELCGSLDRPEATVSLFVIY